MDELARIAAEGEQLEAGAPPAPGAPEPEPQADPAEQWAQLPAVFGSIVCVAMPELKPAYSDANCRAWGNAMVPLAQKYGWDVEKVLAWLGPHIGVIVATIPMAGPTYFAVKHRVAQRKAAEAAQAKAKQEAPAKTDPQPAP